MARKRKPDFSYWIRQTTWTLEEAALIINGIEPARGGDASLLFNDKKAKPPHKLQTTYELLKKVPRNFHYQQEGLISPHTAIHIANENELLHWEFDDAILKAQTDYIKEEEMKFKGIDDKEYDEFLASRERRNLLKTIGIFVKIFVAEKRYSPKYLRGDTINASQISKMLIEKAESLGIETEGLKSLNRKITAALDILDEESNNESND